MRWRWCCRRHSPGRRKPRTPRKPARTPLLTRFFYETRRLQADFTQLEYDGEGVFQRESTGRLYLSRPGRFRLDYLEPDELIIWADGENLSLFDKELEQVTVYKQTEQLRESAAALLAGDASVLENYEVIEAEFDDGLQWFDLTGADAEEGDLRLAPARQRARRARVRRRPRQPRAHAAVQPGPRQRT